MTRVGYSTFANAISKWLLEDPEWSRDTPKEERADPQTRARAASHVKDRSQSRQDWIQHSNTIATRHYPSENSHNRGGGHWKKPSSSWGANRDGWRGQRGSWNGQHRRGGGRRGGYRPY